MLKITGQPTSHGNTLLLEGKLVGQWVEILRSACPDPTNHHIDLSRVSFIDHDGIELLRDLQNRGLRIDAASGFISELLKVEP